jgi:hypothetical protein
VVDHGGQYLPGWPRTVSQTILARPALADLDDDDKAEIIFGSHDSTVAVWNVDGTTLPGWPIRVSAALSTAPAVGDLDGDGALDVVIGSVNSQVHAWHASGAEMTGWPVSAGSSMLSYPALADIDNDGRLEVIVGSQNGRVNAWNDDGTVVTGDWPYSALQPVQGDPAVGDVNGDGDLEIIVGSRDGLVHAITRDGLPLPGWPRRTGDSVDGGPTLGDPDRDNQLEVAVGSADSKFYLWDFGPLTYNPDLLPWFTSGRSFLRQGSTVIQGVAEPEPSPVPDSAMVVMQNPTVTSSVVRYFRRGNSGEFVEFALFDGAGGLLNHSRVSFDVAGHADWILEPRTSNGVQLGPGLYFVRGVSGADRQHAKWVYLR